MKVKETKNKKNQKTITMLMKIAIIVAALNYIVLMKITAIH